MPQPKGSASTDWSGERRRFGTLNTILIVPKNRPATHLMVLCHGFGAPGDDLAGLAGQYAHRFDDLDISPMMLFPAAPIDMSDEGLSGGRAWWRLNMARLMELSMKGSFDEMKAEVPPGIDEARNGLVACIEAAKTELKAANLPFLLGGFSQGAMLAVDTALRGLAKAPEGMVLYSGALICEPLWREASQRLHATRIFQSHGFQDTILPVATGKWLGALLDEVALEHELHLFDGPHTIPMEAIDKTAKLLSDIG